ncbi:MAG: amidohydrolase family protein [Armatimonadota bacterium]
MILDSFAMLIQARAIPSIAITHVSVIPMDREVILTDQTVVTQGSKIVAIGDSSKVKFPAGAEKIDGKGKFLIPGLIDLDVQIRSKQEFPLYLANGVTTVLNHDGRPSHLLWRNQINNGSLRGPNIVTCGPKVIRPRKATDFAKLVDIDSKAGYDSVFITAGVSPTNFAAMVTAARNKNRTVFGNIPRAVGLPEVLRNKMPIVNIEEVFNSYLIGSQDINADMKKASRMIAQSKVPVIANLISTTHNLRQAEDLKSFLNRTETQFLPSWQRRAWQPGSNEVQTKYLDKRFLPGLQRSLINQKEIIRQLISGGATILVGTNANSTGIVPGFTVVEEIQNLNKLGYSNYRALRASTLDSAVALNQSNMIGSIAVGKRSDLVLLSANPLADLGNLKRRVGVVSNGKWLSTQTLQRDLNSMSKGYEALQLKGTQAIRSGPDGLEKFFSDNDPFKTMRPGLMLELLRTDGENGYFKFIDQNMKKNPKSREFTENQINTYGYQVMNTDKQIGLAIKVFKVNVQRYPKSANTCDSLAEAYLKLGNKAQAINWYRQAVRVDPNYPSSVAALKSLGAK